MWRTNCKTILIFLVCAASALGQDNWTFLNPKPTGFTLRDFAKSETGTLWIAGDYGTLLYCTDGGHTWNAMDAATNAVLYDILFLDEKAWIVGSNGTILHSKDNGQSWQKQASGTTKYLHKAQFLDADTGWAVARDSVLLRTTDGGQFWQIDTLNTDLPLNDFHFLTPKTGWLTAGFYSPGNFGIDPTSAGMLLKTDDGGESWAVVDSGTTKYGEMFFLDEKLGWLATASVDSGWRFLRTENGGEDWEILGFGADFHSLIFATPDSGWGTFYSHFGRTSDGGKTWDFEELMEPPSLSSGFRSIYFEDNLHGWTVGTSGFILESSDGGLSWQHLDERLDIDYGALNDVQFHDENTGWIVGQQLRSSPDRDTSLVLKTVDGGYSWQRYDIPAVELDGLFVIDPQNLWTFSRSQAFVSKDGGTTWSAAFTLEETGSLRDIYFADAQRGWLLANRALYMTVDGGKIWQKNADFQNIQFLRKFIYVDSLEWFIPGRWAGRQYPAFQTNDGGETWTYLENFYTELFFLNTKLGWAHGNNGRVFITRDGAESWQPVSQSPETFGSWLTQLFFVDSLNGWAWNYFDARKTTDGGKTWEVDFDIANINSVHFVSPSTGWLIGSDGWILKQTPGKTTSITLPHFSQPTQIRLQQNYPNPFNPSTAIRFQLPVFSRVNLSIYNVHGQLVRTLVAGERPAGTHNVQWDGSDRAGQRVASGVYIARLQAGAHVDSKKLLLVK